MYQQFMKGIEMEKLTMRIASGIAPVNLRNLCSERTERVLSGRAYTVYSPDRAVKAQGTEQKGFSYLKGIVQVSSDAYLTIWANKRGLQ